MIIVIVNRELDKNNRFNLVVSHGYDEDFNIVVLPNVHPNSIGAKFNIDYNEYVLE